jgi:hypothetical protein
LAPHIVDRWEQFAHTTEAERNARVQVLLADEVRVALLAEEAALGASMEAEEVAEDGGTWSPEVCAVSGRR